MKRNYTFLLNDIISSCDNILDFVSGYNFELFKNDKKTISAVIREFEVIGEAANNLPESITKKYTDIQWDEIIGMRHRLIHGYFGVDYELVWFTIQHNVQKLITDIQQIITDL
ncbi:MAG: DUF86 domain-containing protein [Candidatus Marinimicrobia bacterium]|nr:DUF86 domain-containing protein [Candidatus Neomarinimicrobiota bacterium]